MPRQKFKEFRPRFSCDTEKIPKPKIQNSKSEKQKEKRRTVPNRKVSEHLTLAKGLEKSQEIRGGPGPTT